VDAVRTKLDEVVRLVEQARTMPMSSSVMLHRGELLGHLAELRSLLPRALDQAREVLVARDAVVEQGRREAERVLAEAYVERDRLVQQTDVWQHADAESARLLDEARAQVETMRVEVEDYVDAKLANFEIVLHKTLAAVERGRAKLAGRSDLDELAGAEPDPEPDAPLPR
jgi:cell division septum initiation protein DivIVA